MARTLAVRGPSVPSGAIPASAGIGLKAAHYAPIVADPSAVAWVEAHTENFMGAGGPPHRWLSAVRRDVPLSLHGVALSLGSATGPDPDHLARVKAVVDRYQPDLVSEHLAWSGVDGLYLNDLLPLPLTEDTLSVVADNVDRVQTALGRTILVENPSTYLAYRDDALEEADFLAALAACSGCGLLLDVNNVHVSAVNRGTSATAYLERLAGSGAPVGEMHLAGHAERVVDGVTILLDDHGSPVRDVVWTLYEKALALFGPLPTLVEWDSDVPTLDVLCGEAAKAEQRIAAVRDTGRKEDVHAVPA